ncbi:hypothetical protein GLX27_000633 [Malassezia furfur]|uniref:Fumarate hydratase n=1 Tax=Malassezia furfur TaxID=55194 RepID=A0ABY8ELW3_MALFU|nr:hypothetical protein GLX27_000633 [Malassezia furfur]
MSAVRTVLSSVPQRAVRASATSARLSSVRALATSAVAREAPKSSIASLKGQIRKERDTFGDLDVPADKYWGAQTQRYVSCFLTQFVAKLPHRR